MDEEDDAEEDENDDKEDEDEDEREEDDAAEERSDESSDEDEACTIASHLVADTGTKGKTIAFSRQSSIAQPNRLAISCTRVRRLAREYLP